MYRLSMDSDVIVSQSNSSFIWRERQAVSGLAHSQKMHAIEPRFTGFVGQHTFVPKIAVSLKSGFSFYGIKIRDDGNFSC